MRQWLVSNGYAIAAVALIILLVLSLGLLVLPQSCLGPGRSAAASPAPPATSTAEAPVAPSEDSASLPVAILEATVTPAGTLFEVQAPGPASKNFAGEESPAPSPAAAGNPATGLALAGVAPAACSARGNLDWSTTASAFQVVCRCTLTLPQDGWAFISADASLSGRDCEYEAHFRLGIDNTQGDPASDRWVDIYSDSRDGMDAAVAVSALRPLQAGTHTFYLLARRSGGMGTVLVHDASLSVLAWPAAAP